MFALTTNPINQIEIPAHLKAPKNGGIVLFEGLVRNHNEGQAVRSLEYECFEEMAQSEGNKIINEAISKFGVKDIYAIHRYGHLEIGEVAIRVAASAPHRHEAFLACQYVIDEIKHRVPIWKKEHYLNGPSEWVACHQCADHGAGHDHDHGHAQGGKHL
ncbi:MAG: molybdenum cofactor biosynthesis protein MoaE [Bdellovibrio sp.]|nr:molybdenum cofactor biosynthesis protein MoaE [Bdellovibrio sp.]